MAKETFQPPLEQESMLIGDAKQPTETDSSKAVRDDSRQSLIAILKHYGYPTDQELVKLAESTNSAILKVN